MKRSLLVFVIVFGLLLATLLLRNRSLFFRTPVYEDGDNAANTILVLEAKQLQLLVGNYSRMGFNHPGPALLYWLAAAEATLYDRLHAVPAPHNAQMIGQVVLAALLVGLTLMMLAAYWRTPGQVAVATALVLGTYALTGNLSHHWFPHVYCPIYLAFAVSVASVSAGRVGHAWILALTGSLLVHGHVCFVMFVVPLTLGALFHALRPYRFRVGTFVRQNAGSVSLAAVIVGLFLLPIALHTILHYPGEFARYARYSGSGPGLRHGPGETLLFCVQCTTGGLAPWYGGPLLLGLVAANVFFLPPPTEPERRRISVQLLSVAGATAFLVFIYALFGVDDLVFTYTCFFAEAVSVILLLVAGLNGAVVAGRTATGRRAVAGLAVAGVLAALLLGKLVNTYKGATYIPALRERLRQEPALDQMPVVVSYAPVMEHWEQATALMADQLRQGRRFCLADKDLANSYSGRLPITGWEEASPILRLHIDRLDFAPTSIVFTDRDHPDPVNRFSLYKLDRFYRLGSEAALRGPQGRALLGQGWSIMVDEEAVAPRKGEAASFRLVLEHPVSKPLLFTLLACGSFPPGQTSFCYEVVVNGERMARWEYQSEDFVEKSLVIPAEIARRQTPLMIRFEPTAPDTGAVPGGVHGPTLRAKSLCLREATSGWSEGKSE